MGLIAAGAAVLALMAWGVYSFVSKVDDKPRKAPKISLIPTTPPPPPPPPKEEKKPEPPKDLNKPPPMEQPKMAPPAPSADLKMDGPAGDGPSAFSAGKITSEDLSNVGKAPVVASGGGAVGGGFSPFTYYANLIKGELQRQLTRNKDLREMAYKAEVQVWVNRDGSVGRFEVVNGTGDKELDALLKKAIESANAFSTGPPEKMPQPIRLRISTGR
jgi:protein TonB